MKFDLGKIVATAGVLQRAEEDKEFTKFVVKSMARYVNGDWGEMCEDDKKMNDDAVANGDDRIVANYEYDGDEDGRIYIITEWDRSVTTILFPSEY